MSEVSSDCDKLDNVLNFISQVVDEQKKTSSTLVYSKSKIDDIFSMMHNKSLQVNVCVKEIKEMKVYCAKLRKEMGELKHEVFDCRKLLKAAGQNECVKPSKSVHWAPEEGLHSQPHDSFKTVRNQVPFLSQRPVNFISENLMV